MGVIEIIILLSVLILTARFMTRKRSGEAARHSQWPALLPVFGVLLAVPIVLGTIYFSRTKRIESASFSQRHANHSATASRSQDVWANLDDWDFEADVHPSKAAAAKPLARMIRSALETYHLLGPAATQQNVSPPEPEVTSAAAINAEDEPIAELPDTPKENPEEATVRQLSAPDSFLVYNDTGNADIVKNFAKLMKAEFPISKVQIHYPAPGSTAATDPLKKGVVRLTLIADDEHVEVTVDGKTSQQIQGRMICKIETEHGAAEVSNRFLDKPWVENLGAFVSSRPQKEFVAGYSLQFVSSQAEASRLAMANAQMKSRFFEEGISVTPDESFVVDRFAQKLSRPYSDVWREAVLLDVSPDRMEPAIAAATTRLSGHRQQQFRMMGGLAGLLVLTIALCVTLNLLTHGYYRRRLGLGWAVVAVFTAVALFVGRHVS